MGGRGRPQGERRQRGGGRGAKRGHGGLLGRGEFGPSVPRIPLTGIRGGHRSFPYICAVGLAEPLDRKLAPPPETPPRLSFLPSMITVSDAELLEREEELDTLRALLADAREGRGGITLIEGPAGQGKTALLRAVRAEASGMRVLHAVGAELERDFPFGVVRQLFAGIAVRGRRSRRQRGRARTRGPQRRLRPRAHPRRLPQPPARAVLARRQPRRARAAGDRRRRRPLGRRRQPEGARDARPPDRGSADRAGRQSPPRVLRRVRAAPARPQRHPAPARAAEPRRGRHGARWRRRAGVRRRRRRVHGRQPAARARAAPPGLHRRGRRGGRVRRAAPRTITRMVQGRLRRLPPASLALAHAVAALEGRAAVELAGLETTPPPTRTSSSPPPACSSRARCVSPTR